MKSYTFFASWVFMDVIMTPKFNDGGIQFTVVELDDSTTVKVTCDLTDDQLLTYHQMFRIISNSRRLDEYGGFSLTSEI